MTELAQQIVNGLAVGSVYALIALGFGLLFSVLGLLNFAYGDTYMVSTYVLLVVGETRGYLVGFGAALATALLVSLLVERFADRPLRHQGLALPILATFGCGIILRALAQSVWGVQPRRFPPILGTAAIHFGEVRIPIVQLVTICAMVLLSVTVAVMLRRTRTGAAIRATAENADAAALVGIPLNRIVRSVYLASALLAAIAGLLFASTYNAVYLTMGIVGVVKGFTAAVIGGVGNIQGAVVGGLALGLAETLVAGYVTTEFRDVVTFTLLIAFLVARPNGIWGKLRVERV